MISGIEQIVLLRWQVITDRIPGSGFNDFRAALHFRNKDDIIQKAYGHTAFIRLGQRRLKLAICSHIGAQSEGNQI